MTAETDQTQKVLQPHLSKQDLNTLVRLLLNETYIVLIVTYLSLPWWLFIFENTPANLPAVGFVQLSVVSEYILF